MEGSKKYSLNKADAKRIGLGALVAIGGAAVVYLGELIPNVDFGQYTPIAVALGGILVNTLRKFLTDYTAQA